MQRLRRSIGLPTLLFTGVGVIVGAGIYSILGAAAGLAGRGVWLSLLLASLPALLAALCYAELAARYPRAGGAYTYVRQAFPRSGSSAFVVGFAIAATEAATVATVGIAFGGYLSMFVPVPVWLSALGLIAACTAINLAGIRESSWVAIACTSIEVAGLIVILGAGVESGRFGAGALDVPWPRVPEAAALCFFVFTGFEGLANLAEETREAERRLPVALIASLAFTTVLYVGVALAAVALVSPRALAGSDFPLATAAGAAHPALSTVLAWIALFSTANTALITLVVGSRLLYGMADQGDLPALFGRTLSSRRTPWVAALVVGGAAAALLPLGSVAIVGSVSSLLTLAIFAAVGVALIAIRRQGGARGRGFRVPWSIARVPVPAALLVVSAPLLATRFEPQVHVVGAVTLALGFALLLLRQRRASPALGASR
jgi:APA family basic amino acid/polyamine antiporter